MKRQLSLTLVALAALVTGCPHNEYEVELKPRGNLMERKMTLSHVGDNATSTPSISSNELAAITKAYSSGDAAWEADKFVARGSFFGKMPADFGGAGSYTNLATSLGSAGFYLERFRGDDDPAAVTKLRFQAADQFTDLIIGWARTELGKEPNFENLRQFLDVNVRYDLKNASEYIAPLWTFERTFKSVAPEGITNDISKKFLQHQMMRLGQYFVERGYLKLDDLASTIFEGNWGALGGRPDLIVQRLFAGKLGIPETSPIPKSLAFLSDPKAIEESWNKYLLTTEFYRTKLAQWETKKPAGSMEEKPKPADFVSELALAAAGMNKDIFGTYDQLTVKLSLPAAPVGSNGKWDETNKVLLWESDLEYADARGGLPVLCYASWSQPDESFQKMRFGRIVLTGRELVQDRLWRSGLDTRHAAEWDALVAGLQPGTDAMSKLEAFKFSDTPPPVSTTAGQPPQKPVIIGVLLLEAALAPGPDGG